MVDCDCASAQPTVVWFLSLTERYGAVRKAECAGSGEFPQLGEMQTGDNEMQSEGALVLMRVSENQSQLKTPRHCRSKVSNLTNFDNF